MKILVTGGGGFLGSALSVALLKRGHQVRIFSRGDYPKLKALGIEVMRGDVADKTEVLESVKGCDVVFHVAAKAGIWGAYEEYHRCNVLGTENIIKACLSNKIQRLIFTSTPSVVFDGTNHSGVNEEKPYSQKFFNNYQKTKTVAEDLVLKANSKKLATVALRPHLIWGPGDNHLIPRLVSRAKSGQLRIVGDGKNLIDSVYIDNAVHAHLLALDRLSVDSPISGKAYFITNGEPIPIAELFNKILKAANVKPVDRKIPARIGYCAGALLEVLYKIIKREEEPRMTRFLALQLSYTHSYDISAARRDLGYNPSISIDEGIARLKESFRQTE